MLDEAILSLAAIAKLERAGVTTIEVFRNYADRATLQTLITELSTLANSFEPKLDQKDPPKVDPLELPELNRHELCAIGTASKSWFHKHIDQTRILRGVFRQVVYEEIRNSSPTLTNVQKNKDLESRGFIKYSEASIRKLELVLVSVSLCLVQLLPVVAFNYVKSKPGRLILVAILIILVSLLNTVFANSAKSVNFGAVAAFVTSSQMTS